MQLPERLTRRRLLGLTAAAVGSAALPVGEADANPRAVASGAVTCVLAPEMTEGPYYVPAEAVRRDITEGRPGTPLELRLTVVNASTCKPLRNASVDIWHADASGVYSGVAGNSGTFLRGVQRTDRAGLAVFDTIYPGWYRGRAVHIHVKVHLGGNVLHTGQLFFPDAVSDQIFKRAPYRARGAPDTPNTADSIFRNGGNRSLLKPVRHADGYLAAMVMGVFTG
jgi:protocatechuate 3,4-dioxygenase beta subunit